MEIIVDVVHQKMHASITKDIAAGSQRFVKFKFNLDEDWNGLKVFAQFRQGDIAYNDFLDDDNSVYLPAKIKAGYCCLMLYGSNDTTIGTVNPLVLKINDNKLVSDAESTEITESLYNQLVTEFNQLKAQVKDFTSNDDIMANITTAVNSEMSELNFSISDTNHLIVEYNGKSIDAGEAAVSILSINESTADNGYNVVEFSNGTQLKVKNGSRGNTGTSVSITNISESTVNGGNNTVTFSDGKTLTVKNGNKGDKGDKGEKGDPGDAVANMDEVLSYLSQYVGEDKVISRPNIISVDENVCIYNLNLTSNAPSEGTEIHIYDNNENIANVDDIGRRVQPYQAIPCLTMYDVDNENVPLVTLSVIAIEDRLYYYGQFTPTKNYDAQQVEVADVGVFRLTYNTAPMLKDHTYICMATLLDCTDYDINNFDYDEYKIENNCIFDVAQQSTATIDTDGAISTELISRTSVVTIMPELWNQGYTLNLEYVTTDFATKDYVDETCKYTIDQTYNADSENAQSGKAVAKAANDRIPKIITEGHTVGFKRAIALPAGISGEPLGTDDEDYITVDIADYGISELPYLNGEIATYGKGGKLCTNTPTSNSDCANKEYVDNTVSEANNDRVPKPTFSSAPFLSVVTVNRGDATFDDTVATINDNAFGAKLIDDPIVEGKSFAHGNFLVQRDGRGNLWTGEPVDDQDCVPYSMYKALLERVEALESKM